MKVKDLLEKLSKLDDNLEIICYTEDESLVGNSNSVKALDVIDVSETKVNASRGDDGRVQLQFTGTESDRSYALIQITSDL